MRTFFVLAAAALVLSACGGGSGGGSVNVGQLPSGQPLEDSFGAGFGQAFRAAANSDPRDPAAADIVPVDLTKDPTPLR